MLSAMLPMRLDAPVPFVSSGGSVFITPRTQIGFTVQDFGTPASGVALTQYAVDTGNFTVFAASFTLTEGAHTVRYRSQDRAGNLEATRTAAIQADNTPPVSTLVVGDPKKNLILGILGLQPTGTISTVQLIGWFPVLFITFLAAIYALLKVPALTNHVPY